MKDAVEDATTQPESRAARLIEPSTELAQLREALAVRDRFLSAAGHELRNSLAPMLLISEQLQAMAADPAAPPQLASRAQMLARSLGKLTSTIDRIGEVAGLRRDKLEVSTVDLAAIVVEVCGDAARDVNAAGAVLAIDAPVAVPGRWDPTRLKKIVECLLSNALRHGGGRIEISVTAGGATAELVVRDHGAGLEADSLARLFDPFTGVTAHGSGGFGIGLWVVKTLCTAMGGSIAASNATNGGARFAVVLPRG